MSSCLAKTVYVAEAYKILFIDRQSNAIVGHVSLARYLTGDGAALADFAVTPNGKSLYALVSGPISQNAPGALLTIDTATAKAAGSAIAVGHYPSSVAVAPDGTHAYVANWYDNNVSVIDISAGG
jgi:DNA-binding beta-propeller fold protein YncE